MLARLFLLFVLVPLADLILLLLIAQVHWLISVASVIISGLFGAWLLRRQGAAVAKRLRSDVGDGQIPTDPLMDGGMVLLAAGLLLTPGLITDAVGITLLIPACRRWYRSKIRKWLRISIATKAKQFQQQMGSSTIDADFQRKDPNRFDEPELVDDQLIEGKST